MSDLQINLIAAGMLSLVGMLVLLLIYLVLRRRHKRLHAFEQSRDDLASMMILLQTMRDLLDQQKQLARQLNANLEKKIKFIKETVDTAFRDLEEVRAGVKLLTETMERAKTNRESPGRDSTGQTPDGNAEQPRRKATLTLIPKDNPQREKEPSPRLLALPEEPPPTDDVIDAWVGLDFGGDEPDPFACDVPDIPPEVPGDAEAARDAFRALLNLDTVPTAEPSDRADSDTSQEQQNGGNGRSVSPLYTQIYEYSDAGMTIGQIAQELGMGKGEVRLILSLRKERST